MAFKANIEVTTLEEFKDMNGNLKSKNEDLGCPACGSTKYVQQQSFSHFDGNNEFIVEQRSCADCNFYYFPQRRKEQNAKKI